MSMRIGNVWYHETRRTYNRNVTWKVMDWLTQNGVVVENWTWNRGADLNDDGTVTIDGKTLTPPEKIMLMAPKGFGWENSHKYGFESQVMDFRAQLILSLQNEF